MKTPKEYPRFVTQDFEPFDPEVVDGYNTTLARLKFAGLEVKWSLRQVYTPIKELLKKGKRNSGAS